MELKCGFKPVDAGAIPEGWGAVSIRELEAKKSLRLFRGRVISQKDMAREPGDYPVYSSSVQNGGLFGRYGRYMFDEELITWSIDGGGNFFYRPRHRFSVTNVCGYMRVDASTLDCHFMSYQLQHLHSRQTFDYTLKAHPSVIRGIYVVPLPPLPEQRAITAALSDVDALIGVLDRLIAKKRDLKQAAMQQLLSGQTRLPGFSGQWEVKRFSDIAAPRRDRVHPRGSGAPDFCVELEHIEPVTGQLIGSTSAAETSSLKSTFHAGDVLFGKLRAYLRKYWLADRPGVCSTEIWVLAPITRLVTAPYLFQIVKTDQFIDITSNAYGTHMPRSDWNIVKNYEVRLPRLPEQAAIGSVLSDMDAEIAILEQRRAKTRALKQGMMQELLTGRTRLV
jgi:restriction endonuclease S subunit